ncbi:hypothetical protein OIU84_013514 [Salix udensis]|uniref:Uncharacterized protein n=1 Tax=Salix udensis TaxID=889485 RepID=A0AAD6JI53_9ROSI|nr:hypothetical protein OIU84_013514 [Salix udensis]
MALNFSASYLSQKVLQVELQSRTLLLLQGLCLPHAHSSISWNNSPLPSPSADGYESDGSFGKLTIREQLAQLAGEGDGDFSIQLCKKDLKKVIAKPLTVSQKRNIRRQAYLNEVSQRNDSVFFATIGAFIILPPIIILGIAILTGYVQLLP